MSTFAKRLQVRLRRLRMAKGWTQVDLATKARVTQALISQLEGGKKASPSVVPLLRIAGALGVTVEELVG
jgi:transcriptional regulator with XRE-family HTH domain